MSIIERKVVRKGKYGVIALIVSTIIVSGFLIIFETKTANTPILHCVDAICTKSNHVTIQALDPTQVENLDMVIRLKRPILKLANNSGSSNITTNEQFRQIEFPPIVGDKRFVNVPMRLGTAPLFEYETPDMHINDLLRIRIVSSRELYLFINGKIAYTHRYATPVFMVDPRPQLHRLGTDSSDALRPSIVKFTVSIFVESSIHFRVIEFGLAFIGILVALLIRKLLWRMFQNQRAPNGLEFPTALPLYFWLASLGLWLIKPRDGTGATSLSPFAPIGPAFSDYFQVIQTGQQGHPYDLGASNYPPFALLFGRLLNFMPNTVSFVLTFSIGAGTILLLHDLIPTGNRRFGSFGKWLFIGLSYPIIFAIIRGNFDLIAAALIFVGFLASERKSSMTATIAFALAIAIKAWPIVFLLLLLKRGRKRLAFYSIILAGLITMVSFMVLGYPPNAESLHILLTSLSSANSGDVNEFGYSFTLRGLLFCAHLGISAHSFIHPSAVEIRESLTFLHSPEVLVLIGLAAAALIWLILKSKSFSSGYLYACALVLLIPSPTYTYRAIVLLFYFYLRSLESKGHFLVELRQGSKSVDELKPHKPNSRFLFSRIESLPWVIIVAPTTFYYVKNTALSTASFLQPLALLSLVFLAVKRERQDSAAATHNFMWSGFAKARATKFSKREPRKYE